MTSLSPLKLDGRLRQQIRSSLDGFDRLAAAHGTHRRAAVVVGLVEEGTGANLEGIQTPESWSESPAILLTRRSRALRKHAGQWALPGGVIEPGESPEVAAARELEEEVGITVGNHDVLGLLDDFTTRSGFAITPVVVWIGEARSLLANDAEVASIHRIPVRELMRSDSPWLEEIEDSAHPVLKLPLGSTWVGAPTAAFLYQFREVCMAGRATRVAHYEQPPALRY